MGNITCFPPLGSTFPSPGQYFLTYPTSCNGFLIVAINLVLFKYFLFFYYVWVFFGLSQIFLYLLCIFNTHTLRINFLLNQFVAKVLQRLVSGFFHSGRFQIENCNRLRELKPRLVPRADEFLQNNES